MGTSSWTTCNTTLEESYIHELPLFSTITYHQLGLFLSALFGLLSILIALFLVLGHATHYLRPWEQKHIIRILLMIPVYSSVNFLSFVFYRKATYWELIGNCYEAFAIASFFTLLCHYVAPDLHEQKEYFRGLRGEGIKNWFWGVFGLQMCTGGVNRGPFRKPRSGLTWFNIIWIGVFQYCFIRVFFTIVSVITQHFGLYCEASLSPAFAHIWVTVFEAASVSVAMFCLVQFYLQLKDDLAEHKPFLKVLCIKLVIFFSFWQTIIISFLASTNGPLQPTAKLSYQDIKVGIPAVLLCTEMAIFAVLHIFAFPWKPYSLKHSGSDPLTMQGSGYSGSEPKYVGGFWGIKAMGDAFNPWDIIKATARGVRWLFVGVRKREQDVSYRNPPEGQKLDTAYPGPSYAGNGEPATELRGTSYEVGRGRAQTLGGGGVAEDDRAGLLAHSGPAGRGLSASPYRTYTNDDRSYTNDEYAAGDDSQIDLGARLHLQPTTNSGWAREQEEEGRGAGYMHPGYVGGTAYKGADYGASECADERQTQHPALRHEDSNDDGHGIGHGHGQWDMWAGATRPGERRHEDPGRF